MDLTNKLEVHGVTDVGRKRSHNEDCIANELDIGLVVVADGMGGYNAGEVASAMAVNTIVAELRAGLKGVTPGQKDEASGFSRETMIIKSAILKANESIFTTAQNKPDCHGMGTTLVAAAFYKDRFTVAHVGDSRLYRCRENRLEQITKDHSLLQELVDKGFYTPEEAKQSMNKNLVTRAVGIELDVVPDFQEVPVQPGDMFLLCSDGLTDLVDDEDIETTLNTYTANLESAANLLVQMANDAGGKDNISVILARALEPSLADKNWYSKVFDWF